MASAASLAWAFLLLLSWSLSAAILGCGRGAEPAGASEASFRTSDNGEIHALLYGKGSRAVVLAHGKVFNKESWTPLAERLAGEGFRVLALDFRGYGRSTAGSDGASALHLDVLAAIRFLREQGAERVSVVGGSMGALAAARAAAEAPAGTIDRLVLLSPPLPEHPEAVKAAAILVTASRGEPLLPQVKTLFEKAPEPKRLELFEGDAHAQHTFATDQGERLTRLIVDFLKQAP